ncbi:uncharacterized protein LOC62_02G003338 [Vanrija pseudolonga]|uniref:Uncharacterized protein n=1 Tax=Vanrija pseudolonga TaxID=143232 RepID=A0AAF0YA52_9TREE|nr:hypothetical protein LOC62_02G003338 [Vanrija pseudolonga]
MEASFINTETMKFAVLATLATAAMAVAAPAQLDNADLAARDATPPEGEAVVVPQVARDAAPEPPAANTNNDKKRWVYPYLPWNPPVYRPDRLPTTCPGGYCYPGGWW